jgi:hypothetical protein
VATDRKCVERKNGEIKPKPIERDACVAFVTR